MNNELKLAIKVQPFDSKANLKSAIPTNLLYHIPSAFCKVFFH